MSIPERRQSRVSPRARLRPGYLGHYPELLPDRWYPLDTTVQPASIYVWLNTPHGALRVQRTDLDIQAGL